MNLFFDTEFTGLHKDTTLISIGIISENGSAFYAEFTDYEKRQMNDWIDHNVIRNTVIGGNQRLQNRYSITPSLKFVIGSKEEIKIKLIEWLNQFDSVQFVSDVCHYDFVLLIDLFGGAFDLPKQVSPACHDINQDIAGYLAISEREAFDVNREEFAEKIVGPTMHAEEKHNALHDATVIRRIYNAIKHQF